VLFHDHISCYGQVERGLRQALGGTVPYLGFRRESEDTAQVCTLSHIRTLKSPKSQVSIFQNRKVAYSKHHATLVWFLLRKFARISICHWLNSAPRIWNTCIIQSLIRAYPAHASVTQQICSWRLRIVTGCQSDMAWKYRRKLQIPGRLVTRLCRALPWLASHRRVRNSIFVYEKSYLVIEAPISPLTYTPCRSWSSSLWPP